MEYKDFFFFPQTGRKEKGDPLNSAIDKMTKKTRDLRRQVSLCYILPLINVSSTKKASSIKLTVAVVHFFCCNILFCFISANILQKQVNGDFIGD